MKKEWWMTALVMVLGAMAIAGGTFVSVYRGRVYPGVKVAGVELGGRTMGEAEVLLQKRLDQNQMKWIWQTREWVVPFEAIGAGYDVSGSAKKAFAVGRMRGWARNIAGLSQVMRDGQEIEPEWYVNEARLEEVMSSVSAQINVPAQEPEVKLDAPGRGVSVSAGENGQEVDIRELAARFREAMGKNRERINVPVTQLSPKLSEDELERARLRANSLLGKKVDLVLEGEGQTWEVDEEQLVWWLDPTTAVGWKQNLIEEWVGELAMTVDRTAQNASFRFVSGGRVEEFKPAKTGIKIRQSELVGRLSEELAKLEKGTETTTEVELPVEKVEPEVRTGDVNELGIQELLGKGESWFAGSITNRIFNLQKAGEALNGVLVAPGETFSFNQAVGEVSAATGYRSAYIIKEGKTILGDGGGVCQTSTTLFRAVLAAGLPVMERTAHAYRVAYYEQNYQVGFDATVFQPAPDFKFKNDTPAYILIQTEFDEKAKKLTFLIYGTNDGRKVELSKARIWESTPPPPDLYIDDPTLAVGVVRQTEHKAWGAKVAFDWRVTRGEEVLQERTFFSNYRPWQAVYLRGTKVN